MKTVAIGEVSLYFNRGGVYSLSKGGHNVIPILSLPTNAHVFHMRVNASSYL